MKRRTLIRHLERFGCVLLREGAKHSRYINVADPRRFSTVPRHTEIADLWSEKSVVSLVFPILSRAGFLPWRSRSLQRVDWK
jgi:mRNA interferase HicA